MGYYVSNPAVDLTDKFILSFNVDFTPPASETLCYGIDPISRRANDVTQIDHFINKVNRGVVLDNGTTVLSHSARYATDGTYVWNKKGENNILDLDLKVWNNKVYEEIEDISYYDPDVDLDVGIDGNKLFKYVPGRYIIDRGVIKLVFAKAKVTSICTFEKGIIVREEYHVHDHLHDFNNKIRAIITNEGSTISLDKLVDESYEHIGTYFFTNRNTDAKVYLGMEGTDALNFSVTYKEGEVTGLQQGMSLIVTTSVPNQKINLGYNLGEWPQTTYGTEVVVAGNIEWGDGATATFKGNEGSADTGSNPLIHTFAQPGEYNIKITGIVRWNGFSDAVDKPNSIRERLTEIRISEGDDYPVHAIAPGAFAYCKHLTNIPVGLFDYCNDIKDISNCFIGCEKITDIPKDLLYYCKSINNFSNCFTNCTGLKIDVPNYWEDFPGATGGRCFRNCTNAIDYYTIPYEWGGPFADSYGGLVLTFTTTERNQVVDLGHILGSHSNKAEVIGGFIDWKDGSILTDFGNGDGVTNNKFKHTYNTPGVHTIILGGRIKWGDGEWPFVSNDLRKFLTNIDLYNAKRSPIYDIGRYAFADSKLTSVPNSLLEYCIDVEDLTGCFEDCQNLTTVPGCFFSHCTKAKNFTDCFKGCTNLRSIPGNIFSSCPNATTFDSTFEGCTSLESVPAELFKQNKNATSFDSTFKGSGLRSIPHDLFAANNKVTNFGDCFRDCMGIEEIPENLFNNCPDVTDFSGTFRHTGIYEIPDGLFNNNPDVLTFQHCFSDCPNLHAVPDGLFDHCTEVTDFSYTFANDPNLESVPEDLFANCGKVKDFSHCFEGDSGITSELPELWTQYDDDSGVKHDGCFDGCENAPNYWNVPESWGGPVKRINATDPAMTIRIVTTAANQIIDLGPILGGRSSNNQITRGLLAWTKDYKELLGFRAAEGITSKIFKHTYKTAGEYDIILSGKLLWSDSRALNQIAATDVRRFIKSITIEGQHTTPIYDLGTGAFAYANNLTTVPASIFNNCTAVTNFSNTFFGCTRLTTISGQLFNNCTAATNFFCAFIGCTNLTAIPDQLFTKCTKVTNFNSCFENCLAITAIPTSLFTQCTSANNFQKCFKQCNAVRSAVPTCWLTYKTATGTECFSGCNNASNYFDVPEEWGGPAQTITGEALMLRIHTNSNNELVDLGYCIGDGGTQAGMTGGVIDWGDGTYKTNFHNAEGTSSSRLKHIYATIGDHTITISGKIRWNNGHSELLANDVRKVLIEATVPSNKTSPIYELGSYAFAGATKLTTVSDKLFSACKVASFKSAFENCSSLYSVPVDLITNCKVSITDISRIFFNCRALTTIPTNLFNGLTALTNASYAFYYSGLTAIPNGLLNTCTALTDVSYCFCCSEITAIPESLFSHCTRLVNCNHCFAEVDGRYNSTGRITAIPANLFNKSVNAAITNFAGCFNACANVTNAVPELWKTYAGNTNHASCFSGCEKATNWFYIPEDWGGPDVYSGTGYEPGEMVMTVTTDATNKVIDLSKHLVASAITIASRNYILPATLNWGDGTSVELGKNASTANLSHTYSTTGNHNITISGNIKWTNTYTDPASLAANSLAKHLTAISLTSGAKSPINDTTNYAFNGCEKLTTIPAGLFEQHTDNVSNLTGMFENCKALTAIPAGLFDKFTAATSMNYCFRNCNALQTVPDNLFKKLTNLQVLDGTFHNCTKLSTIADNLFSANSKVRIFRFTFANTGLQSIPINLLSGCTNASNFEATFRGCTQLTTVPAGLFNACTHVNTFAFCFDGDSAINSLPTLWTRSDANDVIETCCFRGCKTSATNFATAALNGWCHPVTDQRNMTLTVKTTSANQTVNLGLYVGYSGNRGYIDWGDGTSNWNTTSVQYSNGLPSDNNAYTTVVPAAWGRFIGTAGTMSHSFASAGEHNIRLGGAFSWKKTTGANNINIITTKIAVDTNKGCPITSIDAAAFQGWTTLATITGSLFGNCPATITSFANMFNGCTALTSIPTGLFSKFTNLTDVQSLFYNCTALKTVPNDLFSANTKLQNAFRTFANSGLTTLSVDPFKTCTGLINSEGTFSNCTKLTTVPDDIFAYCTAIKTLAFCFQGDTALKSLPKLWEKHGGANVLETGCFMGCSTTATNFATAAQQDWCHPVTNARRIVLNITTSAANEVINLAYYLSISGNRGHIDWGDGTSNWNSTNNASLAPTAPIAWGRFIGTEGTDETNNPLVHTYISTGNHTITIGGNFKWQYTSAATHTIASTLSNIGVGTTGSPLTGVTARAFEGFTKLSSIGATLFDNCTTTTDFSSIFKGCTAINYIPENLFKGCVKATNFSSAFANCTNLTTIPTTLFSTNTAVNNFTSTFSGCPNVTGSIPALWSNHTATGTNCFTGCYKVNQYALAVQHGYATWPNNALILVVTDPGTAAVEFPFERYGANNYTVNWGDGSSTSSNTASHTFNAATGTYGVILTGSATWRGTTEKLTNNSSTFNKCLTSVEVTGTCPIKVWASNAFQNASKLKTIAGNLFNNVVYSSSAYAIHYSGSYAGMNEKGWYFKNFCSGCPALTSIPETLFSGTASSVKETQNALSFNYAFAYCTALKTIPTKLLSGLPNISIVFVDANATGGISCNSMFMQSGLQSIPSGFFNSLPSVLSAYSFESMFAGCQLLTSIPTALFAKFPVVTGSSPLKYPKSLSLMFNYCTGLKSIPSDILTGVPNDNQTSIISMFQDCSGINTNLPAVWNTHGNTTHDHFYSGCTAAPNYNSVAAGWK